MTVYDCRTRCNSTTSELLVSPDGSTICLLNSYQNSDCQDIQSQGLSLHNKMSDVVRVMSRNNSGLDVRDRIWLKLKIPDAFTGTNLVNWLYRNVHGFSDRREARKYATGLLKGGFIVSAVNNQTFSEQRYYHISPHFNSHVHPGAIQKNSEHLTPPESTFYSNPCFDSPSSPATPRPVSRQSSNSSIRSKSCKTWQAVRNKLTRRGSLIFDTYKSNAV